MWLYYWSTASLIACACVMCCCSDVLRTYPQNYTFLFTLTICESVLVGFISSQYTWQSVLLALGMTVGIFLLMTFYAATTSSDFTGAGPYLFAALSCIILFSFVIMILGFCGVQVDMLILVYDLLGVLLFTFYIVFDTQMILGCSITGQEHSFRFGIDEYVFAALHLYLDILNLFLHLLRLFGERR